MSSYDTVSILMGNGDGTFQPAVDYSVGLFSNAIVVGDFSGNGILDLAVLNPGNEQPFSDQPQGGFNSPFGPGPGYVQILMGNGDGTFQPAVNYTVGDCPVAITDGDFSGNGIVDLAVENLNDNDVSILMGNGDGTFQPAVNNSLGGVPSYYPPASP